MSNPERDDYESYEYDDQGNKVLVRYATVEEMELHSPAGPIRPVTSARLAQQAAADRERGRIEQRERQRGSTVMRTDGLRKEVEEAAAFPRAISPICPTKRAMDLNLPEDEG